MKPPRKILIIGLDGANWTIFDEKVLTQHMPNLNRLIAEGTSGVLRSTHPPITAAAWTTLLTGCSPARHQVMAFEIYSFEDHCLHLASSTNRRVPTMWNYFSERGLKVGSVCVPFTWPTEEVNGIMVAGCGCPDSYSTFTYPAEFGNEILRLMPDFMDKPNYNVRLQHHRDDLTVIEKSLAVAARSFEERAEVARIVYDRVNPDVALVQFQDIDGLQHLIWEYMAPNTRDNYPQFRDLVFALYRKLDEIIGELLRLAGSDALVVVVSDHGLGPLDWRVNGNILLRQWGYLRLKSGISRLVQRIQRNWSKLRRREKYSVPFEVRKPVDWKRTRAVIVSTPVYGLLYLNVKGRQKSGCVNPGAEYDRVIQELRGRLLDFVNPETGERCFAEVLTPDELWKVDGDELRAYGDLILIPRPNYVIGRTFHNNPAVMPASAQKGGGVHRMEGIHVFHGPGVRSRARLDADIADIFPTITACLGLPVPKGLDGRARTEIFTEPPPVLYAERKGEEKPREPRRVLSEEEERRIRDRLKGLGYLE